MGLCDERMVFVGTTEGEWIRVFLFVDSRAFAAVDSIHVE